MKRLKNQSLKDIVVEPLKEFFNRSTRKDAVLILAFILLYKLGDAYASLLTSPFYIDIGFSKSEIAVVDGTVGFASQFIGLFIGGSLIIWQGINRSLWVAVFCR